MACLPVLGGGFVGGGEGGDVVVAFGGQGGAGVDDVDAGAGRVGRSEAHVDGGDHDVGDEVGVLEVTRFEIEERVDPDGGDGAVLDGEDGALFVVRGLRIEELRIPMLAGPGAFAFWAEEWRGFGVGQVNDDIECGLRAEELRRRRCRLARSAETPSAVAAAMQAATWMQVEVSSFALLEVMAVGGFQGHAVQGFELLDFLQGLRRERRFAFEGVEDDALEQIAEGHVFLLGDGFEDLEHAFFEANAGLDALDFDEWMVLLFLCHVYQCTKVH